MADTSKKPRRAKPPAWDRDTASAFVQGLMHTKLVNGDFQDAAEAALSDVGPRLPHLSLRFLFQRTSLPFERTILIFGPTGSNKSSLLYWFYDLVRRASGQYLHIDTEDKDTPVLRLAMTGYDRKAGWVKSVTSMDDFQVEIKRILDWYRAECGKKDGPGKRVPLIVGIDSLVAKMTVEAMAVIDKNDGAVGRRFADEARSLSDWFKYVPALLQQHPIMLAAVNHDKPVPGQHPGTLLHKSPGGTAPTYYATYRILAQKIKALKQQASGWEGNLVKLTMEKCSLGPGGMSVEVEFVWRTESRLTKDGRTVHWETARWNWDKATTEFLYRLSCDTSGGTRGKAVNAILGLTKVTGGKYYAEGIGVTRDEPLPPAKLAQVLESRLDVLAELEARLGIHPSFEYVPGEEFDDQKEEAKKLADLIFPTPEMVAEAEAEEAGPVVTADPDADEVADAG